MHIRPWLVRAGAIILCATAILKLFESGASHSYFKEADPLIWFLTNRQLMMLAAGLELAVAGYIFLCQSTRLGSLMLLWFCTLTVVYKLGLQFTYSTKPCSCLGILNKMFNWNHHQQEMITWAILALLASLAVAGWSYSWRPGTSRDARA